jgi:hypothetical protein
VFGLLEIKRSAYAGVDEKLEKFSEVASSLAAHPHPDVCDTRHPGMGIVCVLEEPASARLQTLFDEQKAVAIFEKHNKNPQMRRSVEKMSLGYLFSVLRRLALPDAKHPAGIPATGDMMAT